MSIWTATSEYLEILDIVKSIDKYEQLLEKYGIDRKNIVDDSKDYIELKINKLIVRVNNMEGKHKLCRYFRTEDGEEVELEYIIDNE